jgi:CubicO group peptidase (beta-lactamase class C family)
VKTRRLMHSSKRGRSHESLGATMNDEDLQQLLGETADRLGIVGAQLSLYDGQSQRNFVTGYRNRELRLPVTAETVFQIGSTTKVFNAALILSLVDAGRLNLDAPVCTYIRDFRLADVEAAHGITLRQLLSMSAGLDNGPYYDYGRGDDALGRYVEALAGVPQIFAPGTAFGYSNASSNVAGYAAARVMGETWEKLLTERIWGPLGLSQSALFAEELLQHPVALGYEKAVSGAEIQRTRTWSLPRSLAPAGSLTCCSAGDLIRLARLFLDRGKAIDGTRVLSADAVDIMQCPHIKLPTRLLADEWCVGPYRKQWGGHVLYGHSGTNTSGSSLLLWCPEKNIAIATLVNVKEQGYPLADAIGDVVFPQLFGIDKPLAARPEDAVAVQTDLRPYLGRFEAFGMSVTLAIQGDNLVLNSVTHGKAVTGCKLIPLGEGRFLPCDLEVSGNRNWDVAFWGVDASGRATHLLQGVFPLRRTS